MNKHTLISYVKSIIRIIGYITLIPNVEYAVVILIIAEILGIIEEYVI